MLSSIIHDEILELNLARPPVNAINKELAANLAEAIKQAPADGFRAIVLSGRPGMFSAGLDVPQLLELDRDGMTAFWGEFFQLLECVAKSTVPVAAAITGHSPAGGAVISLFCDYRVMAKGNFKIGLNEVQVGLVVPQVIQNALVRLIGPHQAERLMVAGALINPDQAFDLGFVDQLTDPENTVESALDWCRRHIALPHVAMCETRKIARADICNLFADTDQLGVEDFVSHWFHDSTQQALQELVARLKGA